MKPPSERARLLLERYREAAALDASDKQRLGDVLHERVLRGDLPRFDVGPGTGTPQAAQATVGQKIWSTTAGKVGLVVIALGSASGVGYQLQSGGQPVKTDAPVAPVATVAHEPPRPPPASTLAAEAREPTLETPLKSEASGAPLRAKPEKGSGAQAATSTDVAEPTIDEEVKLVTGAQAALRASDAKTAFALLNEHAKRFPSGKLVTLRQVTHMQALCQSGQAQQARQEASSFLTKNPNSPFAERVNRICSTSR